MVSSVASHSSSSMGVNTPAALRPATLRLALALAALVAVVAFAARAQAQSSIQDAFQRGRTYDSRNVSGASAQTTFGF